MKMMKRFSLMFVLVFCICFVCGSLAACGETKEPLESITLDQKELNLYVGDTSRLKATTSRDLYEDETLVWVSDNEGVATVSKNGSVTVKAEGTARITAEVGEVKSEACVVKVSTRTIKITAPDDLTLDLLNENKKTLSLSAISSDGSKVTWTSENDAIATVDENGTVTATGRGEVKITARVGATQSYVTVKVDAPEDYYLMERLNNASVYANPGVWSWFSQQAAVYTLVADPVHVNGKATLSFSNMVFTDDEAANGTKMEYYFRYQPDFEEGTSYRFTCKMTTTISGRITVGIDDNENYPPVEYNLVAGEVTEISVDLTVVAGKPINIRLYIAGATEENPLTVSLYDYTFVKN